MILNSYETIYVLKPEADEEINLVTVNKCKILIKSKGGENICVQHKGRRHLSFDIDNNYDGIYVQMNYEGNGIIVQALDRLMKFDENIIRYLTVKQQKEQVQNL